MTTPRRSVESLVSVAGQRLDVLGIPEPPAWYGEALCAQTDPDGFYPEKGGSTREAKKVCGTCPVLSQCLTYALDHQERFGIWGGKSERERRKILRERSAVPS